jgi:DNA-directed RNA polymerase subunit RPC12/RpoP
MNRCPTCGASEIMHKVGTELQCRHCGSAWCSDRVEEEFGLGEGIGQLQGTIIGSAANNIPVGVSSLMSFHCTGCGAEVTINTQNALTARCHWCRHIFGINEQIPNAAVPDAILPFRITKGNAVARIRKFVKARSLFALKAFKDEFTPENVVRIYLPYMVVDAKACARINGRGEKATRHYKKDGKNYYDADIYLVERQLDFTVDDLVLDSSSKRNNLDEHTNNIINTILPFDTKNALKWDASYLVDATSEKRDLNVPQLQSQLRDQLLSIARAKLVKTIKHYGRGVRWEEEHIDVQGTRWISMYLPVWLYAYHQPDDNEGLMHYIAVNGRSGETMGSVPVQKWKLVVFAVILSAAWMATALWVMGFL